MSKIYIPDKQPLEAVYKRSKHLAIVAHADDIEMLALMPIAQKPKGFFGIVVGDNKGKPIKPEYKNLSPDKIQRIREKEQEQAARAGGYSGVAFLRISSKDIKSLRRKREVVDIIFNLIKNMPIETIYTHSLFDNHPTHTAVAQRVVSSIKKLPLKKRPKAIYGMEVWGSLDWLPDKYKVAFDVSSSVDLIKKLLAVYKSQYYKGHRYDKALLGRLRANAVFNKTHAFSGGKALIYGLDLSPLFKKKSLTGEKYIQNILKEFFKSKKYNL